MNFLIKFDIQYNSIFKSYKTYNCIPNIIIFCLFFSSKNHIFLNYNIVKFETETLNLMTFKNKNFRINCAVTETLQFLTLFLQSAVRIVQLNALLYIFENNSASETDKTNFLTTASKYSKNCNFFYFHQSKC